MGNPRRQRLLNAGLAVLTAGSVGAAPMLAMAVPSEAPVRALDPVEVRVGRNTEFTRVEFAGVIGQRARIRQEGREAIIRLGMTAAPDISQLRVNPPPGVTGVEVRPADRGVEIVLTLAEGASIVSGHADGAAFLNIRPNGAAAAPAPAAAQGTVAVAGQVENGRLTLTFPFSQATPAAVVRRGPAVWIVFAAPLRLDLSRARDLGPATGLQWTAGPSHTAVRLSAPDDIAFSARADGDRWIITLGGAPVPPEGQVTLSRDDQSGPTALVAAVAGAAQPVWLSDPAVGDRFLVTPALGPAKGWGQSRRLIDLTLLESAQGLGLAPIASDLSVAVEGDLVRMSRPGGLTLSPPAAGEDAAIAALELPQAAPSPALVLERWASTGEADYSARRRQLEDMAAQEGLEGPSAPSRARLGLARFLMGNELAYETIGVINQMAAENEARLADPEARGLRGAARAMVGRYGEALADFSVGALASDPSASAWRGYIAAQQQEWDEARRQFTQAAPAIDAFPPKWRARFGAAHALAAMKTGDLEAAEALIRYALSQHIDAEEQLKVRLIQAELFELRGDKTRAVRVFEAVGRAPLDDLATEARMNAARIKLDSGQITTAQAIEVLEPLRWRWRGDATELKLIRTLGGIYLSQGRYREALEVLRGAGDRLARLPEATELQADLSAAFRALFLEGRADGLQPIQAVALFYDFRDLTPVGAEGDDMVRRLARRLVDVDLLDQAAELLDYQVNNRLEGVAKASVATDLARIHLMNRKPEQALQAIWNSRTTLLPTAMQSERRVVEARALAALGRHEHALEVLGNDQSPEALLVRGEAAWRQQAWAQAGPIYERRLGERWRDAETPLTPEEESWLVRAGVAYSLANDGAALTRLSGRFAGFTERARAPDAVRIALAGPEAAAEDLAAVTRVAASAETFAGWVAAEKQRFRQRTGGAAPARAAA
ncbi:hypothetical protein Q0812_09280 [Brevundimonas sp. 2R-24]|uniref:Tetratricopeptide repeat protein n=1 Tax=Peiella sedimenti TaxID=3061083 RepID=A0ABT8SM22_9CAUL|nr:hypothetical protein [Caulobacteraceae bacterium XZ-24]